MDYLELRVSEIMQYKVENQIHFELVQQARVEMNLVNCQGNVVDDMSNQHEKQTYVYLKLNYSF